MKLNDHPTVKKYLNTPKKSTPEIVDCQWLREIILYAGADDVGFVEIKREGIRDQKDDIQRAFPRTKSIISYVCRLNVPQLQSADRSLADVEFIALESE